MVEHFPPDRANQPFSICVLPWRSWRSWSVTNAHSTNTPDSCLAVTGDIYAPKLLHIATELQKLGHSDWASDSLRTRRIVSVTVRIGVGHPMAATRSLRPVRFIRISQMNQTRATARASQPDVRGAAKPCQQANPRTFGRACCK